MGLWKFIGLSPFLLIGGHSAFVAYHQNNLAKNAVSADTAVDFRPGSTNDMLLDNMNSGDVILIRRKWYYNHLPVALSVLLYRSVTQSEFDHLGVVVLDKFGNPWIVENSPFDGLKCTKMSHRLKANDSELIAMIPLEPRPSKPLTFEKVQNWTNTMTEMDNEVTVLTKFSTSIIWRQLFGKSASVPIEASAASTAGLCPNALLFRQNMDMLGIRVRFLVDTENGFASIKTIEDRLVQLKYKDQLNKTKISLSRDYILLQTR